ncbi:MAG UNVERIFIED_CONTAM: hypothetical protein LVR18_50745 [Planctomycetaceae bacterium]|jgi:hypothetical protein
MFFWIRELAGWALVGGSLFVLRLTLGLAMNTVEPRIVEAAVVLSAALGLDARWHSSDSHVHRRSAGTC